MCCMVRRLVWASNWRAFWTWTVLSESATLLTYAVSLPLWKRLSLSTTLCLLLVEESTWGVSLDGCSYMEVSCMLFMTCWSKIITLRHLWLSEGPKTIGQGDVVHGQISALFVKPCCSACYRHLKCVLNWDCMSANFEILVGSDDLMQADARDNNKRAKDRYTAWSFFDRRGNAEITCQKFYDCPGRQSGSGLYQWLPRVGVCRD
jgi:hypothetical protein